MNEVTGFRDVSDREVSIFADCPLAKQMEKADHVNGDGPGNYDAPIVKEVRDPIKNKLDGLAREKEVAEELDRKYPPEEGYQIVPQVYLRSREGDIIKDPVTGEARRVDFMGFKNGNVVYTKELTKNTAGKTGPKAKEKPIRDSGGNIKPDNDGNLAEIPSTVRTRIERRE